MFYHISKWSCAYTRLITHIPSWSLNRFKAAFERSTMTFRVVEPSNSLLWKKACKVRKRFERDRTRRTKKVSFWQILWTRRNEMLKTLCTIKNPDPSASTPRNLIGSESRWSGTRKMFSTKRERSKKSTAKKIWHKRRIENRNREWRWLLSDAWTNLTRK
jgi:hypothetical protein